MAKTWMALTLALLFMATTVMADENLDKAGSYFKDGNFRKAEKYAKKILKKDPDNIQAGILLAESISERGKVKPAIDAYQKMITKHPDNIDLVFRMGLVYNKFSYHENAVEAYRQVLAKKPDYALARYRLGLSLAMCMDLSAAYEEYRILKGQDEKLAEDLIQHIKTNQ